MQDLRLAFSVDVCNPQRVPVLSVSLCNKHRDLVLGDRIVEKVPPQGGRFPIRRRNFGIVLLRTVHGRQNHGGVVFAPGDGFGAARKGDGIPGKVPVERRDGEQVARIGTGGLVDPAVPVNDRIQRAQIQGVSGGSRFGVEVESNGGSVAGGGVVENAAGLHGDGVQREDGGQWDGPHDGGHDRRQSGPAEHLQVSKVRRVSGGPEHSVDGIQRDKARPERHPHPLLPRDAHQGDKRSAEKNSQACTDTDDPSLLLVRPSAGHVEALVVPVVGHGGADAKNEQEGDGDWSEPINLPRGDGTILELPFAVVGGTVGLQFGR